MSGNTGPIAASISAIDPFPNPDSAAIQTALITGNGAIASESRFAVIASESEAISRGRRR